jgi:hypothetical protein
MPGETARGTPAEPPRDVPQLIAARLRQSAAAVRSAPRPLAPAEAVEAQLAAEAAVLARAGALTSVPVGSHRRHTGAAVNELKRTLRRLLYPLLDMQTEVNAANARLAEFTLRQLAAQAERIEQLERRVEDLTAERGP